MSVLTVIQVYWIFLIREQVYNFFFQIEELIYLAQNVVLHNLHNVIMEGDERGVEGRERGGFNKHCPVVFNMGGKKFAGISNLTKRFTLI